MPKHKRPVQVIVFETGEQFLKYMKKLEKKRFTGTLLASFKKAVKRKKK